MRIEAIVFDMDDTLIDWSEPAMDWVTFTRKKLANIHRYLTDAGHDPPPLELIHKAVTAELRTRWAEARENWSGVSFVEVLQASFAALGFDLAGIDAEELLRAYNWAPMPGVAPYEDAIPALKALRRRGYKIGLITNSSLPMWMRDVELAHYNLLDYIHVRLTSGDVGYIKPHPAIYQKMLQLLDASPERSLFVGDWPEHDIAGANNAGMISVLLDPPHLTRPLNGVAPDYTITSLAELLPLLDQLEEE